MSFPLYGRDIPQALQDLSQFLLDAPTTEGNGQPEGPLTPPTVEPTSQDENPEMQDPAQVQVDHHQQEAHRTTLTSLLRPLDIPEPVTRSAGRPSLRMQPITAKPWPKPASNLSLTSTRLPASEHLHQP